MKKKIFLHFNIFFSLLLTTLLAGVPVPYLIQKPPTEVVSHGLFQACLWKSLPIEIQNRVVGKSWKDHPLCPKLEDLAYLQITHWNMEGNIAVGELIFHVKASSQFLAVFRDLFENKFPIYKMHLIDDYDADDELSMEDNNSSCFCFRMNTTNPSKISNHALGIAVDLNPLFNPYINTRKGLLLPKTASQYVDRQQLIELAGAIHYGDACYQAFISYGFEWGGDWDDQRDGCTDYQHFSLDPSELEIVTGHENKPQYGL